MTRHEFHEYFMNTLAQTFTVDGREFDLLRLGWTPGYCKTKRAIGRCRYRTSRVTGQIHSKRIEISQEFLRIEGQNDETMRDVVLHEIAHAIDVEIRGKSDHSHHWQRVARQVGAKPERTTDQIVSVEGRYVLTCPKCGKVFYKHRRPTRNSSCAPCGQGYYDPELRLTITDTKSGEIIEPRPQGRRRDPLDLIGF